MISGWEEKGVNKQPATHNIPDIPEEAAEGTSVNCTLLQLCGPVCK